MSQLPSTSQEKTMKIIFQTLSNRYLRATTDDQTPVKYGIKKNLNKGVFSHINDQISFITILHAYLS